MSEQQFFTTPETIVIEKTPRLKTGVQQDTVGSTVVNLAFDKGSRLAYEIDQETGELSPTNLLPPSMREDTVLANQSDLLALSEMGASTMPIKDLKAMTGKDNIGRTTDKFSDLFETTTGETTKGKSGRLVQRIQDYTVSSVIPGMMDPEFVSASYKAAKIDYHVKRRKRRTEGLFEQSGTAALVKSGARNYLVPLFKEIVTDEGLQTAPDTDAILYLNLLKAAQGLADKRKYDMSLSDLARWTFSRLSEEEMWTLPVDEIPSYQGRTNNLLNERIEEVIKSFDDEGIHYLRGSVAKALFTVTGNKANRGVRIVAEIDDIQILFDPSESDLERENISVTSQRVGHSEYHMPAELPGEGDLGSMSVQTMNGLYVGLLEGRGRELSSEGYSPQAVSGALKSIRAEMKQRGAHPEVLGFGNILKTKRVGGVRKSSGYVDPGNMNKRA